MPRALRPSLILALCLSLLPAAPARAGNAELRRALDDLRRAVEANDFAAAAGALQVVLGEDGRRGARELLDLVEVFPEGKEPLYWQVVGGLASFSDEGALDAIGDWLGRNGDAPRARDLLFALQNNRSPEVIAVYRRIVEQRRSPLRAMALDRLGELATPEAVDLILQVWAEEEGSGSEAERRARSTLTGLFGEDLGDRVNWAGWWDQNRDTALAGGAASEAGATGTVRDEMDRARSGGLASMSRGGGRVIVLQGRVQNFDQIEDMLARLEVRHEAMQKERFLADIDAALEGTAALILNCNFFGDVCYCRNCKPGEDPRSRLPVCTGCDVHDLRSDRLSDEAIERIRRFVREGGSVFTEDWGLKELTARAWPEHVEVGPDLPEQEVDYSPVPGQTANPLLRGVLARRGEGTSVTRVETRWKVDNLSPSIRVVDAERVAVLLSSQTLRALPDGNDAVAVTFSPGERTTIGSGSGRRRRGGGSRSRDEEGAAGEAGIVLHVLSHFGKQRSQQDEFTLQNLLVNFLLEAQARHQARQGG